MKLRIVMLFVIGPMFALAGYLTFQDISEQRRNMDLAHQIALVTSEGSAIDALIHQLQRERGFSAGFIASSGTNFPSELRNQRLATKEAVEAFEQTVKILSEEKPLPFQDVSSQIAQLGNIRSKVDAGEITVPAMASFYTETIASLFKLNQPSQAFSSNGQVGTLLTMRSMVSAAKENAGLERAMGATGLGAGFSLEVHARFVSLGGAQTALLAQAGKIIGDNEWLSDIYGTDTYRTILSSRDVIGRGYTTGTYGNLTAPDWFEISSEWIDLLREEEIALFNSMQELAADLDETSRTSYQALLWSGSLTILGVVVFALFSFERMVARIKYLTSVIEKFTNGEFDVFVKGIEGKDELSKMAKATYHFKQDTLEMRRNAKKLESEQKRRKQEQDQVVGFLSKGLGELADGNLAINLSEPFPEEYEGLREDFNSTAIKLHDALKIVRQTTLSVRSKSNELGQSSEGLSSRIENQAATLEQTAIALQEITSSVRLAAESAQDVQQTTESARSEATNSGQIVKQAVLAMDEIQSSSDQISKIIDVIDDIAFQTNLLALNAGVEAARAGEAGRGFAVVASEVGALAQRSAEAATEIQTLIGKSASQVENGVKFVNEAGTALDSIVDRVGQISQLVSGIADSSKRQASELGEIDAGVSQLDEVTKRNTVMVRQSRSTSESLSNDANHLEELVEQFRLNNNALHEAA